MDNELYHYGVLGMRWGVRKSKSGSSGFGKRSKRSKLTVDPSYKKAHSKKKVKYMSDNELREVNNRLNLEQNYRYMTQRKSKGKAAVDAFVSTAKTITAVIGAYNTYKEYGAPIAKKVLNKIGKMKV